MTDDQGPTTASTSASKERLQKLCATARQHASTYFHSMIQHVVIQHLHDGMDRACFGIVGAVDQAFQPCVDYCAGTHGAWLDCRKQIALFQTVVSNRRTGVTQRHHLGVSRWIAISDITVPATTHNFPVAHHDCAYRNFPRFKCALRRAERFFHKQFIRIRNRVHAAPTHSAGRARIDASRGRFTKIYFPALSASR